MIEDGPHDAPVLDEPDGERRPVAHPGWDFALPAAGRKSMLK
jgi:hypothetical protein